MHDDTHCKTEHVIQRHHIKNPKGVPVFGIPDT